MLGGAPDDADQHAVLRADPVVLTPGARRSLSPAPLLFHATRTSARRLDLAPPAGILLEAGQHTTATTVGRLYQQLWTQE